MSLQYGEKYVKNLTLIRDTTQDSCIGFELPIFQVVAHKDGQHFIQLFGITREEPTLKFALYLNFKFRDFEMEGDNSNKRILDILYIHRANKNLRFDPNHESFIRFLQNKFNLAVTNFAMRELIEYRYTCLSDNLLTLGDFFNNKLALKLFHENPYYECYLNIDFPNKKVEFREKDDTYRENIIKSFQSNK